MSTTAVSAGKLRTYATWVIVSLAVVALTWAAVLYWWHVTQQAATVSEIILFLVALPCVLLACFARLKWRTAGVLPLLRPASAPMQLNASSTVPANRLAPALSILNAWAVTGCAASADELAQLLEEQHTRPQPDPHLTNDDGFPVLSGRVTGLDTGRVEQWFAHAGADQPQMHYARVAVLRSLALLELLIDQIAPDLPLLAAALDQNSAIHDESGVTLRGAPTQQADQPQSFRLLVKLIVSAAFLPPERQLALNYLEELLPLSQDSHLHIEMVPALEDVTALALLNRFSSESQHDHKPQALLVLACDSMLCPDVLKDWQTGSRLFGSRCQNGLMAGEGAFGLLCANDAALAALSAAAIVHLAGTSMGTREHTADAPGKPSHTVLDRIASDALQASCILPAQIGTVVCDSDHRTSRVLECIGTMAQHTPHLDAIRNRHAINEACGHLGAASSLATLAIGVQRVVDAAHPVLVLNLSHASERAAAVLIPAREA